MVQTQEAPRHAEHHKETVPHAEKPAPCHKLTYIRLCVVQRADHSAVTVSSRAFLHEALQPVDTGSQSPCLLCESADTQDKRNVVCVSEML